MTPPQLYRVEIEEPPISDGLFEMVRTTIYRVVDTKDDKVLSEVSGEMSASLDREMESWGSADYNSAAAGITLSDDGCSILIQYHDGREEYLLIA